MKATEERVYVGSQFDMVKKAGVAAGHLYLHPGNREANVVILFLFHCHLVPYPSLWMVLSTSTVALSTWLNLSGNVLIETFIGVFPW